MLAVVGEEHEDLIIRSRHGGMEIVVVRESEPDGLDSLFLAIRSPPLADVKVDPDAITNVYYTSGTTGPPKGCMVGHDYWIRFVELD